ncbi:hypothetical protein BRD15_13210 [Halobacteriales archaeon SW_6_65_15]|nr:MAG: hypothetical protein BRD15_13210 [Halobacteriales archaeon SW_6_65_15]
MLLLVGGFGPAVGVESNASLDRTEAVHPSGDAAQYEVSLDNVTVQTWLLRDSTVRNATVQEVVIENVTTEDGARENVTVEDVTVGRFVINRGRLLNVTATTLIVRNKSVLDVPGGDFFDPDVEGRTIERQWTRNATVSGVVIDQLRIDAAYVCGNTSLGEEADDGDAFDPRSDDEDPAITVENGSAEEALIIRGAASNWSVGSVDEPEAQNASLPQGCQRGIAEEGDDGGEGDGQDGGQGDDQGDGDGDGNGQDGGQGDGDG